jgi:hypothetical protein
MLTFLWLLLAAATFLTAVFSAKGTAEKLTGVALSGLPVAALLSSRFYFGPGPFLGNTFIAWMLVAGPAFFCLGYLFVVLVASPRGALWGFVATVAVLATALYLLDSLMYVEFKDSRGHPVKGATVEIVHSSYWWGTLPGHRHSDENGIARVGLMTVAIIGDTAYMVIKGEVNGGKFWPKEAVTGR